MSKNLKKFNLKIVILGIISILSCSTYSQSRYELLDNGNEKFFLSDSIAKMTESGLITDQPIIVINGIPFRYQDLEKQKLPLSKIAIEKIVAIDKQKGINIYGNFGEAGVLIITTPKFKIFLLEDTDDSRYYLVDKIRSAFENNAISETPLIAIEGVPFPYDKALNTIFLPLKKDDIDEVSFINKNTSNVIFGENETFGAVLITKVKQ